MPVTPIQEATPDALPLVTNDAVVLGMLMVILGFVFWSSSRETGFWKRFYTFVPSLLLCYFLPSLLSTAGIVSGDHSSLYFVASRYLLPTSLVLLTLSIDLPGVLRLGPKALIMFFTGTLGIVLGGPLAIIIVSAINPEVVGGEGTDAIWRGLTTVAGSWIGGGANQLAMKETFEVPGDMFSTMVAVDVIIANIWLGVLLFAASRAAKIDAKTGADASAITTLRDKIAKHQAQILKIPNLSDTMIVLAVGFAVTALSHVGSEFITTGLEAIAGDDPEHFLNKTSLTSGFFWLIVLATTGGVLLSFTRARQLEGVGASRIGSVFIYVLVATIGMGMNLMAIFERPELFGVGAIWIAFHGALLVGVALLIKAPMFYLAVGSQANVGGAASAPIVAAAFHPSLAPVGVLLAVVGYALGTYAAWGCGLLMQAVAPITGGG
jgi:uncharacterized membrane protein